MAMNLDEAGTVTLWVDQAKSGDPAAIKGLWDRYEQRLTSTARAMLANFMQVAILESSEDVARSAFHSFYQGLVQDRFIELEDREDLWNLLRIIAKRKAIAIVARERRQRRGSGIRQADVDIEKILGDMPDPEWIVTLKEEYEHLMQSLPDENLRLIAVWTMEGYSQVEIAERLGCSRATVNRKLGRIRELWGDSET